MTKYFIKIVFLIYCLAGLNINYVIASSKGDSAKEQQKQAREMRKERERLREQIKKDAEKRERTQQASRGLDAKFRRQTQRKGD